LLGVVLLGACGLPLRVFLLGLVSCCQPFVDEAQTVLRNVCVDSSRKITDNPLKPDSLAAEFDFVAALDRAANGCECFGYWVFCCDVVGVGHAQNLPARLISRKHYFKESKKSLIL
jgi:hypothetical protein